MNALTNINKISGRINDIATLSGTFIFDT